MTNQEAIQYIRNAAWLGASNEHRDKIEEAVELAVEALKAQDATGDTISKRGVSAWLDNMGHPKLADIVMDKQRFPSAQSERPKGEWIDYTEDGYVECPFCHSATNCDGNKAELHFCFSCGADMRGKQDE